LLLHQEKLFDQTRELTYPLLIALLIPAHPLLFSFWKYSFSDTRDRLKINRLSLCSSPREEAFFPPFRSREVGSEEDLIKRRWGV